MLRCENCGEIFEEDELEYERVCWEDYYGVSGSFQSKNYGSVAVCPYCHSEDVEEYEEEDEDE